MPVPLSGQGTSLALVGAYVLAGELAAARGNHHAAFAAYSAVMRPFVERNQRLARQGGATLVPRRQWQLTLRNRMLPLLLRLPPGFLLTGAVERAANAATLKDYAA